MASLRLEKSIEIKSSDKMSKKESCHKGASGRSHCLSGVCSEKSGAKTAASPTLEVMLSLYSLSGILESPAWSGSAKKDLSAVS